ncbi:sulfatase family protein [Pontiella sulfatireligans]|uniref:Arylsulfatase n=1 Tax=Pontiella sulfatireligans TaxID=2750658 RepID=A0A6C2UEM4_9BACT|nr:sulfatase [Pontiella sulfatireligans]SPS74157.1 sulfatase S1_8 [Kiritimatiellales bacterium]VGO18323.1 Arylsulfatase [Pontiella sulfatireligans]
MKKRLVFAALMAITGVAGAAPAAKRPNILFIIADDASFDHFGVNGCTWVNTPNIDRVAEQGINFTSAYTPNPKCGPSRSVLITGRNPWQLGGAINHDAVFDKKFKTYAEALEENGYSIGFTGKGWRPGDSQGRDLLGKEFTQHRAKKTPSKKISKKDYTKNFEQFLSDSDSMKPFAFWLGCHEPHRAYEFKSGAKNGKKVDSIPEVPTYWPDTEAVRHDMLDYALEVEHFDKHVGGCIDVLKRQGNLENTLVIVTSDNGMPFPRVKGHPYHDAAHMPFMAMWKNGIKEPGRNFDQFISFIDLAPTFMEMAGISQEQSGMQPWAGRSLIEIFKGGSDMARIPQRDTILMGRERNDPGRPNDWGYPVRVIRKGNLFYIHNFEPTRWPCANPSTGFKDTDPSPTLGAVVEAGEHAEVWKLSLAKRGAEELYDVAKDPRCLKDLAGNPEYAQQMAELKKELFEQLTQQGDLRMTGNGDWYDGSENPYGKEDERNFYERVNNGEKVKNRSAAYVRPDLEDGM